MYEITPTPERPNAYEVLESGKPLLQRFQVEVDPVENPAEFIETIKQLDPRFQGERPLVRWELEQDQTQWDPADVELINKTAAAMRMVEFDAEGNPIASETPLAGHYDAMIVLGGARQANLDRARYAVDCVRDNSNTASFRHLIVAGSSRKLNEQERTNTENYAPGAEDEFDLCTGAAKTVARENPGLIVGLSFTDDEKAGTPKIIDDVLKSLVRSETAIYGETPIAAVTTQIYQVSTAMDLARVAKKYGIVDTFVAGNPSDPELIAKRTTATYLTEIIRTLKAAAMFVEAQDELATEDQRE